MNKSKTVKIAESVLAEYAKALDGFTETKPMNSREQVEMYTVSLLSSLRSLCDYHGLDFVMMSGFAYVRYLETYDEGNDT